VTYAEVLALVEALPARHLATGEALFDGESEDLSVFVLVSGRLRVSQGSLDIAQIDVPGAFVGELSALLGTGRTASVTALEASHLRRIGDPARFFHDHPDLSLELARQLAGRLHRLNSYLVDVRHQYADRDDHLSMVDTLLGRIAVGAPRRVEAGSDRSSDYESDSSTSPF